MRTPRTVRATLLAAYHLLDKKSTWTRGALARDKARRPVVPTDATAIRWDATGALLKVNGPNRISAATLLDSACHQLASCDTLYLNDTRGYAAIRRAFRRAIAGCR